MPVLSGDQVLHTLLNNPLTKDVPVTVTSASRDGRSIAIDTGANGFLVKLSNHGRAGGKGKIVWKVA